MAPRKWHGQVASLQANSTSVRTCSCAEKGHADGLPTRRSSLGLDLEVAGGGVREMGPKIGENLDPDPAFQSSDLEEHRCSRPPL